MGSYTSEPPALEELPESLSGSSLYAEGRRGRGCREADFVGVVGRAFAGVLVLAFGLVCFDALGVLSEALALGVADALVLG